MESSYHIWSFYALLPIIAFLYAAVGHGGASGYLALMALYGFTPEVMKPTALLLNLFVAGISFYNFYRMGYFNKKLFGLFAIGSIPMALIGGMIEIDGSIYKKILAVLLLFAVFKLSEILKFKPRETKEVSTGIGILIGAVIGLFSGLIGIGGGIILTPVILLMNWGKVKEAAAVSALFIWVNSASGFCGQLISGVTLDSTALWLVVIALFGGYLGSYLGSRVFNQLWVKRILAFVLLIACVKLILT